MAAKALPSPEVLRQLLQYEPDTGKLFWRVRSSEMFKAERDATAWNNKNAGNEAFITLQSAGYRMGYVFQRGILAHRAAWAIAYGSWPDGEVDHINGIRTDNRLCNLRDVCPNENRQNQRMPATNTSGVMGVTWSKEKGKWQAQIMVGRKHKNLGRFEVFNDAVSARKAAEEKYGFHENHGRPCLMRHPR